jgi:hypothetical protein
VRQNQHYFRNGPLEWALVAVLLVFTGLMAVYPAWQMWALVVEALAVGYYIGYRHRERQTH